MSAEAIGGQEGYYLSSQPEMSTLQIKLDLTFRVVIVTSKYSMFGNLCLTCYKIPKVMPAVRTYTRRTYVPKSREKHYK